MITPRDCLFYEGDFFLRLSFGIGTVYAVCPLVWAGMGFKMVGKVTGNWWRCIGGLV